MVLYKRNDTAKWLKTKSEKDKEKIFTACIKLGRQQRQVYKEREEAIKDYRRKKIEERETYLQKKRKITKKDKTAMFSSFR